MYSIVYDLYSIVKHILTYLPTKLTFNDNHSFASYIVTICKYTLAALTELVQLTELIESTEVDRIEREKERERERDGKRDQI